jgi:resuscitation-promoting factor RpfB
MGKELKMNIISTFNALSIGKQVAIGASSLLVVGSIAVSQSPNTPTPVPVATPTPAAVPAVVTPVVTTEEVTETAPIVFQSTRIKDAALAVGSVTTKVAGVNGVKTLTYKITKTDGKQTGKELIREVITTLPVNEVIADGTKIAPKCDTNYTGGCVPIVSYDLDCVDIGFRVYVVGYDKHGFDGNDNDGIGCESY